MNHTISNSDDTIDSRDVIKRIEELQGERDSLQSDYDEAIEARDQADNDDENLNELSKAAIAAHAALEEWKTSEEAEELRILEALQEEAEGYCPDWTYGAQLIRDDYFNQAMDEMVADCYELPKDLPSWMTITYDYDALQQDYTSVDYDGVTYWIR